MLNYLNIYKEIKGERVYKLNKFAFNRFQQEVMSFRMSLSDCLIPPLYSNYNMPI